MSVCFSKLLPSFCLKLQKHFVFGNILIGKVRLRFDLVPKSRSAIAEVALRFKWVKKFFFRELSCRLENEKMKLRILRCAFNFLKNRLCLWLCVFGKIFVIHAQFPPLIILN